MLSGGYTGISTTLTDVTSHSARPQSMDTSCRRANIDFRCTAGGLLRLRPWVRHPRNAFGSEASRCQPRFGEENAGTGSSLDRPFSFDVACFSGSFRQRPRSALVMGRATSGFPSSDLHRFAHQAAIRVEEDREGVALREDG